jgi:hypothetical protein
MSAGLYNITAEQGATYSLLITWLDQNHTPINITGYTAQMEVRYSLGTSGEASPPILTLTDTSGLTLGGAAGTITVLVSATDTAALPATDYDYDLFLHNTGGVSTRLLAGIFTVVRRVTEWQ